MKTPIFDTQFVVYVDPDIGRDLVSWMPGPAGSAFLELPSGITIEVDYAEPGQLVALHVEAGVRPAALAPYIGAERSESVIGLEARPDGRPYRLMSAHESRMFAHERTSTDPARGARPSLPSDVDLLDDLDAADDQAQYRDSDPRRMGRAPSSRDEYNARRVGQLAVLQTIGRDTDQSDLARAIALIELADAIDGGELRRIADFNALLEPTLAQAGELLVGLRAELRELVSEQPDIADRLHRICARYSDRNQGCNAAARWIDRARRERDREIPTWHQTGTAYSASRTIFPAARLLAMDRLEKAQADFLHLHRLEAAPLILLPDHTISLAYGGRLTVRSYRARNNEWVRVLHAHTLVLLALVPMVEDEDGDWGAGALIPPDLAEDDIVIDITANPVPNDSAIERTRLAIRLGRDAVLASARDASFRGRELWEQAAAAWRDLGDDTRANLAEQYARRSGQIGRDNALAERLRIDAD